MLCWAESLLVGAGPGHHPSMSPVLVGQLPALGVVPGVSCTRSWEQMCHRAQRPGPHVPGPGASPGFSSSPGRPLECHRCPTGPSSSRDNRAIPGRWRPVCPHHRARSAWGLQPSWIPVRHRTQRRALPAVSCPTLPRAQRAALRGLVSASLALQPLLSWSHRLVQS